MAYTIIGADFERGILHDGNLPVEAPGIEQVNHSVLDIEGIAGLVI